MIRHSFVVCTLALAGAAVFTVTMAAQDRTAPHRRIRFNNYSNEWKKLEARVAELEQRAPRGGTTTQSIPLPHVSSGHKSLPKGWVPREFNGQRYYDIPLDTTQQK